MHIRSRKFNNNQNDFETLQKQLNNDFEVHTYLQQHHLNLNNAQSYAQLLNSLILERRTRSKKLLKLKTVKTMHPEVQDTFYRQEFQVIEEKTGKEEEIRKNLERQITETKKSLNLLKGDIGFLVSRNESAQLLGSKVTKVKIVAEDQLKRVSLAYSKDRQEIKVRNEMQKKFGKKIKNISNYESSSLKRSKDYYIENQIRKNEVYNKLYWSQQAAQKSEQIAAIQKQKQKIDSENRMQQLAFLELTAVIKHFSLKHLENQQNVCKLYAEINDFLGKLDLSEAPGQKQMAENVVNILKEYHNLKDNIKTTTQFCNEQLSIKQQLCTKMKECEQQQHELLQKFELQALSGYMIAQDKLKEYSQKLKKFASIIKTFFVLLTYLKKYQQRHDSNNADKKRNSTFYSQNNIKYSNYITQLHKTYQMLSSDHFSELNGSQHYTTQYIDSLYENMGRDVRDQIATFKKRVIEGFQCPAERSNYHKKTKYSSQTSQFAIPMEVVQNEYNNISEPKKIKAQTSEKKIEEDTSSKAQRIRLLQDVDRDYYKMIKSTMKMEKENTRKNYQFQRVFKRAKYASRDDILEEKRFQASFSVLFTKQSSSALTRPLGVQRRKSTLNTLSKTIHSQTMSSFKAKKQVVQPKKEIKRIFKRNLCEERQKKTRLNQKLREALCYSAL